MYSHYGKLLKYEEVREINRMSQPIRAVYSQGHLRLLDPVNLSEGEEIQLMILSDEERVLAALDDLLVKLPDPTGEDIDEDMLAQEIEEGFRGQPPLSDTIIEERREGP
jgi:predicted DNA-binding antitoxin AbrB/MazE fold protein